MTIEDVIFLVVISAIAIGGSWFFFQVEKFSDEQIRERSRMMSEQTRAIMERHRNGEDISPEEIKRVAAREREARKQYYNRRW